MRTFYLTGSEIFDGFSGPFYYENYNSHYNLDSNDDYFPSGSYLRKKYMKNQQ